MDSRGAAPENFRDLLLVGIGVFRHIGGQFFGVDFFEASMKWLLFQVPFFLQLYLPASYGRDGYFEYLMGLLQCVAVFSIFYCPLPVFRWIAHILILP